MKEIEEIKITKIVEKDFTQEMAGLDYVPWFIDRKTGIKYVNTGFKGKDTKEYLINLNLGEDENNGR